MAEPIREVFTSLPDGFVTTYFEQPCTLGCRDHLNRPTIIAGVTAEHVRQFMNAHRRLSSCVERAHRRSQRIQSEKARAKREIAAADREAAVRPAVPAAPPKKAPKPSWKNAKRTTTIGWDGKPLA